jgi:hypothetical protein
VDSNVLLGIDFGTQNTRIAVSSGRSPPVIFEEIPSVVYLKEHPVPSIKRLLGLSIDDPLVQRITAPHNLVSREGALAFEAGSETITVTKLTGVFLAQCAERVNASRPGIVLTASAWLEDRQKRALGAAALSANLLLEGLISTPSAIAISQSKDQERRMVIVECGAGGVSASVAVASKKRVEITASASDRTIGGDDASFDTLLAAVERVSQKMFDETRIFRDQIHEIYLAGELGRTEIIRKTVERIFGKALSNELPRGAGAIGAAILARSRRDGRSLDIDEGPLAMRIVRPSPLASSPVPSFPIELVSKPQPSPAIEPIDPIERAETRPGVALGEVLKGGKLWSPQKASQILALPFMGTLSASDVSPFALPLLMMRLLSRKSVTGTVTLEGDKKKVSIPIHQGVACLDKAKLGTLGLAFRWSSGTYTFDPAMPRRGADYYGFLGLTTRCLRATLRGESEAELIKALGPRMQMSAMMNPAREALFENLGLNIQESNFVKAACKSGRSGEEALLRGGLPREVALVALVMLSAFGFITWRPVGDTLRC